jgi:dihydropteroate synthase
MGLDRLAALEQPILVGTSRKSFLGETLKAAEGERMMGTAATVTASILGGAHIVRVHDVPEMVQVARVADELVKAEEKRAGR